jgi:hypothetical protein
MADAPAMALKSTYHWAPSAMRNTPPTLRPTPKRMKTAAAKGKRRLAGKLART